MRTFLFFFTLLVIANNVAAQTTILTGKVIDAKSEEPLPFTNVVFTGTTDGTTTDFDGDFSLSTEDMTLTSITISFLGYKDQTVNIRPGVEQVFTVKLSPGDQVLEEFVVKRKKRAPKDTPAITLFRRVVANRAINSGTELDFLSYEDYTKTEFDLYNVKEALTERKLLKPFDFVFENIDTTENGTPYLPILLKEKIADVFYRKSPKKTKEVVKADQFSGIEDANISDMVDFTFDDVNVYENVIDIGGKTFVSPFAKGALASYKYFLTDSMFIDEMWCYKLEFIARRKQDLCFTGHAWIHDSTAAIKNIELEILDQINLNFVTNLKVSQGYTYVNGKQWLKNYERMEIALSPFESKKGQNIRILRTNSREKIRISGKVDDAVFLGDAVAIDEGAYNRPKEYWVEKRHTPLTQTEAAVYNNVEKVQESKAYKRYRWLGHLGATGFMKAGPIEFGPWFQMYSWNNLEGQRYKLGFRTSRKTFNEKLLLQGYLAYGTKDELLKYNASAKFNLKRTNNRWHMLGLEYGFDWSNYDFKHPWLTHDHILNVALRNNNIDNLFLIRQAHLFYEKEWLKGIMTRVSGTHKTIYSWPGSYEVSLPGEVGTGQFEVFEMNYYVRFGIGQRFLERAGKRVEMSVGAPVIELDYRTSVQGLLGSDYNYHQLRATLKQGFNTQIGRTNYELTGGKIFGSVPYPLLYIPRGNESYVWNRHAFNAMQEFEFATDMWAELWIRHRFQGLIFNAIPGVRKLKLRSRVNFRAIFGDVSEANIGLLGTNNNLAPMREPYAEISFGVENILKMFRVDYVVRLTQRNQTDVSKYAIKFYISPDF